MLGVTNPFFLRECKDWPNKLLLQTAPVRNSKNLKTFAVMFNVLCFFFLKKNQIEGGLKLSTSAPVVNNTAVPSKQICQLVTRHKHMIAPGKSLLEELVRLVVLLFCFLFFKLVIAGASSW